MEPTAPIGREAELDSLTDSAQKQSLLTGVRLSRELLSA
jgi:hypothetical protein